MLEKDGKDQLDWSCEKWRSTVKEQRNILHEIRKRKANWIGHILRRNCLLQQVIEGKIQGGIEVTGRRGKRHRKLLYDLKEMRGYSYLKKKPLDRTMWRALFGRGFEPVVRQTTKWMNTLLDALQLPVKITRNTKRHSVTTSRVLCLSRRHRPTGKQNLHPVSRVKNWP